MGMNGDFCSECSPFGRSVCQGGDLLLPPADVSKSIHPLEPPPATGATQVNNKTAFVWAFRTERLP